jgi:L-alanine-DL-glutamate epimerase-like enolase superfamily enzyme
LPTYNGETQEQALGVLEAANEWLPGQSCDDWRGLARVFRAHGGRECGSAQCGFETALVDALARRRGEPLGGLLGSAGLQTLETDITISTGTATAAGEAARLYRTQGFRVLKVKIGGTDGPAHDLARLVAIMQEAPEAQLILDGNAALSRAAVRELLRGLRDRRVTPLLLEQWLPKDDLPGMRALGQETGWTVAADESVVTPEDALRVVHAGAAQVINVKLMKAGVAAALDIVQVARATGVGLMIGGNVESILGMTASASFAAALGGFRHVDLDTPIFLAENPLIGGMTYDGPILSLAGINAGHGVAPAELVGRC